MRLAPKISGQALRHPGSRCWGLRTRFKHVIVPLSGERRLEASRNVWFSNENLGMNPKVAASMNSNENFTRTFVALDLPESVKSYLEDNFSYCRNLVSDAKWVNPRAIHLTLKFLGNVPTKAIPSIAHALEEGFDGQTPIRARLSDIGMFPNFERPRVLWVGITDEGLLLANLFHRIEKCLIPLGFAREKRSFRAHLTLARIKPGSPTKGLAEAFKRCMPFADLTFELDKGSFYQSILKSHGAEYTVLKTFLFTTRC